MKTTDQQIIEFTQETLTAIKELAKTDLTISKNHIDLRMKLAEQMRYEYNSFLFYFSAYCKYSTSIETVNMVGKISLEMHSIIIKTMFNN